MNYFYAEDGIYVLSLLFTSSVTLWTCGTHLRVPEAGGGWRRDVP